MKGIGFVLLIAIFLSVVLANLALASSAACTATISNPTGGFYDTGQYVSFTASESNCISPFTYNIIIKPYPSGNVIRNELLTGQTANSVTYTFQLAASDASLEEMANVIVTDSGSNTVGSSNSPYFSVRSNMTTPILSPYSANIDSGNPITFTSSWFQGSSPYATSIYSSPTSTCSQESTLVQQETGIAQYGLIKFQSNLVYPTSNTYYCEFVTDNSTSAYSFAGSLPADAGDPYGVAISTNGAYAYIVNEYGNNVIIVNTASNTVTGSITSGFSNPYGVAFSPSGAYAYVTNFASNNVVIINTTTNAITGVITSGINEPKGVAISPSGTYAYVTNYGSSNIAIINTATGAVTGSISSGISNPYGVAFSPSGTYAYVANPVYNNVIIINTASNTVTGSITAGLNQPYGVAFSPSGGYAYVTNCNSSCFNTGADNVVIIDTASNTVVGSMYKGLIRPLSVAFSPNGAYAYVVNDAGSTANIVIINTGTPTVNSITHEVIVNPPISNISFFPANPSIDNGQSFTGSFTVSWTGGTPPYGASLYSSSNSVCNQQSTLIDRQTGLLSTSTTFSSVSPTSNTYYCAYITDSDLNSYVTNAIVSPSGYEGSQGVAISPSGTYAYVTNYYYDNVLILNTVTNTITSSINSGFGSPTTVAFSPSGTYAYVANYGNVVIINTGSNTVTNSITAGINGISEVAISPSGTYAYVTNYGSNNVVIINTATNTVINSIISGFNEPYGVAFSPSGAYAYVTNLGSTNMVVINTATNTVTSAIQFPSLSNPQGVAISPDGTYAYVSICNYDCTASPIPDNVTIIATATDKVVGSVVLNYGPDPYSIAFSPDGSYAYVTDFYQNNITIIYPGVPTANAINKFSINNAMSSPTLSPGNTVVTSGNPITLSSSWTGGTPAYGEILYSSPNSTCSQQSTFVGQQLGITGTSATFSQIYPSANSYYCSFLTDNSVFASSIFGTIPHPGFSNPQGLAISPTGTFAYATNQYSSNVLIISMATNTITTAITSPLLVHPGGAAFSPNGQYAYITNHGSNVVIVNTGSNTVTGSIPSGFSNPIGVAFYPTGAFAYVANDGSSNVVIVNTSTNTVTGSISVGINSPTGIALSPGGKYLYVENSGSSNIVILNTTTDSIAGAVTSGIESPYGIAVSPSGTYAYVTNCNNSCLSNGVPDNVVIINTVTNTVVGICRWSY